MSFGQTEAMSRKSWRDEAGIPRPSRVAYENHDDLCKTWIIRQHRLDHQNATNSRHKALSWWVDVFRLSDRRTCRNGVPLETPFICTYLNETIRSGKTSARAKRNNLPRELNFAKSPKLLSLACNKRTLMPLKVATIHSPRTSDMCVDIHHTAASCPSRLF